MIKYVQKGRQISLGFYFQAPFWPEGYCLAQQTQGIRWVHVFGDSSLFFEFLVGAYSPSYFLYGFLEIPNVLRILDEGLKSNRPLF